MPSELRGVIDKRRERAAGREGVVERDSGGVERAGRGVVRGGEGAGDVGAQRSQRSKRSFGREVGRSKLRVAEDLPRAGHLTRVAGRNETNGTRRPRRAAVASNAR